MRRHADIEILQSQRLHRGLVFDLIRESIRLPSGLRQELDVVDHPGAVYVAPVLPSGELLLVRQYRHAAGDWLVEIPAGRLEGDDTDRLAAAQRELEEETGHRAGSWEARLEFFPAPGFCSERMTLFVARELEAIPGGGRECDADEELDLVRLSPAEVLAGRGADAKTLLAAALLA